MHKISNETVKVEGEDGKTETIKGYLAIPIPDDADYSPGRAIGGVVFVVDNPDEETDEEKQPTQQTKK